MRASLAKGVTNVTQIVNPRAERRSAPIANVSAPQDGFTLIEVMITVVIIGVLGAIAYPSYNSYILKGKRAECRAAIMQNMQRQERLYTQTNSYGTNTTGLLTFSGDSLAKSACSISSEQCTTSVALSACVRVRSTPNNYTDAEVNQIFLESSGTKGCTGTASSKCW